MAEMERAISVAEAFSPRRRLPWYIECWPRLVKTKPLGTVGLFFVIALFVMGIFADYLAPYGMNETHLMERLYPYSTKYLLGTDHLGRDMLSRIIFGARVSMFVGLGAVGLGTLGQVVIGLSTGYYAGSWWDLLVQRWVDAWMCFPGLIILLNLMALMPPGMTSLIIALSLGTMFGGSRLMRGATLAMKDSQYVEAARMVGCRELRVFWVYILPNVMAPLLISVTGALGGVILAEASLSFLGFGIPAPAPSWGGMLSGAGRTYMYSAPWMAIWPGFILSLVCFGFAVLGDALRDVMDPRLRGSQGRQVGRGRGARQ